MLLPTRPHDFSIWKRPLEVVSYLEPSSRCSRVALVVDVRLLNEPSKSWAAWFVVVAAVAVVVANFVAVEDLREQARRYLLALLCYLSCSSSGCCCCCCYRWSVVESDRQQFMTISGDNQRTVWERERLQKSVVGGSERQKSTTTITNVSVPQLHQFIHLLNFTSFAHSLHSAARLLNNNNKRRQQVGQLMIHGYDGEQ